MLPAPREFFESNYGKQENRVRPMLFFCESHHDCKFQLPEGTSCFGGAEPERALLLGYMAYVFTQRCEAWPNATLVTRSVFNS